MPWSDPIRSVNLAYVVVLPILVNVACQPVPQPFAHAEKTINPIAVPSSDLAGVTILPIPGISPRLARNLSIAMADELLVHEVIAGPDSSNRRSRFLQGGLSQSPFGKNRTKVTIQWNLTNSNGKILGSQSSSHVFARRDWAAGNRSNLRPLVKMAAANLARLVKEEGNPSSAASGVVLHVWPLEGAPKNATVPIQLAMKTALKRRKFQLADSLEGAGLVIAGSIELGPENAEPRPIRIIWSVLNASGKEVGNLTQKNVLPRQALEQGWKTLAAVIADNAADGVSDLVVGLPRNVLQNRENPAN